MKRCLLLLVCLLVGGSFAVCNAQSVTIRGCVTSQETGEPLVDVNVGDVLSSMGVATDGHGMYSIRLRKGKCVLKSSMVGYITRRDTLVLTADMVYNFSLLPKNYQLNDVEVRGHQKVVGQATLLQEDIQALPTVGSEPDVLKALQYLPGVVSGNEGSNNISVRGGNQWGNLVLLDEATIYNPNHALSFFSVFNNDVIEKTDLYKAYFPLMYGGRTSSVIDVKMREGDNEKNRRSVTLGAIASKIQLEGPVKKGKTSYLLSGRWAYPGNVIGALERFRGTKMNFYDVNAKLVSTVNDRDRFSLSMYNGGDHTFFNQLVRGYGMNWGNTAATFRWEHKWTDGTRGNLSALFSNYYYRYESRNNGLNYWWKSNMQSYQLKYDFSHTLSDKLYLKTGLSTHLFTTQPGSIDNLEQADCVIPYRMDRRNLLDMAAYAEGVYKMSSLWQLNVGIRLSALYALAHGDTKGKCYVVPEPRWQLLFSPGTGNRWHAAFTRSSQSLHMLSNSSVGIPSDMWLPVSRQLKPAVMQQATLGYEKSFRKGAYTLSLEAYYRKTHHVVDYVDNANLFLNNQIEAQLATGSSNAYGMEFCAAKNQGRCTGWVSYTLSRVRNKIAAFDDSEYPPGYDRPHSLKVFLNYEVGRRRRCAFATTFTYNSGIPLTVPMGHYQIEGATFYIYSARNGYRAPAYHALDFSMTCRLRKGRFMLSVMNVYNRKNVFTIYTGRKEYSKEPEIYKMYLYGTLPSVSYRFEF